MLKIGEDKSISVTRGDAVEFAVSQRNENGDIRVFSPGDVVRFTVVKKKDYSTVVLQKDFAVTEACETVDIVLGERDTRIGESINKPVEYWYEVEVNPGSSQTIIGHDESGAKQFWLYPEAEAAEQPEPKPEDIPIVDDKLDAASARPIQNQAVTRAVLILDEAVSNIRSTVEDIDARLGMTTTRVNNLSTLKEGSTTADAELIDIRIGLDGTEYQSAGEAVRTQVQIANDAAEEAVNAAENAASSAASAQQALEQANEKLSKHLSAENIAYTSMWGENRDVASGLDEALSISRDTVEQILFCQEDISDIKSYIGYTDSDILGLQADFENKQFARLAGAKGLEAGDDFNQFSIYRDRVRCNVADDGTINALYGEQTDGRTILLDSSGLVFEKMGAPEDSDDVGGVCTINSDEIPHVSSSEKTIHITLCNKTADNSITEITSVLGVPGMMENTYGSFKSSDGRDIELRGFPNGSLNSTNGVVESYDGGFTFFIYPYCSDEISFHVELETTTGYADDGSNGQVMVYQPKFYYRVVPLKLEKQEGGLGYHIRKANYYISATPKAGFKLHPAFYDQNGNPVDYILLSAYEGSMLDVSAGEYVNDGTNTYTAIETGDLLCSVAGVKPISGHRKNLTRANIELIAKNRGTGWHLETVKATSANQLLMMIELGAMNTQTAIGQGVVSVNGGSVYNSSSLTGSTAELGNGTGQASQTVSEIGGTTTQETTGGKLSVSYRGMENPWGNIFKHIQGVNIYGNGKAAGGQAYIADDFNFSETKVSDNYHRVGFTLANSKGYIKAMGYGDEKYDWLLMPSEVGGSSVLPVGDFTENTPNLNGYRIARFGGYWSVGDNGSYAGSFYWDCSATVATKNRNIGGRLMYVPTAVV